MNTQIEKLTQQLAKAHASELDRKLKASIIGSTIKDFKIEKIKDRKTMYKMTILTDAKPVIEKLPSGCEGKYLTNQLIVRVKIG